MPVKNNNNTIHSDSESQKWLDEGDDDDADRQTLFDGAFVLADLLNSSGDFPVERTTHVEENEDG